MRNLYQWIRRYFSIRNNYLFVSLFLSFAAVFKWITSHDFRITDFSNLIPGIATFENVDIDKRVHLLYSSVFLFCFVFSACVLLFYWLHRLRVLKKTVLTAWNRLAAAGILILFFQLVYPGVYSATFLFYGIIALSLCLFQIGKYILKIRIFSTYTSFIWLSGFSFSCAFLLRDFSRIFIPIASYKFHVSYILCFAGLTLLIWFASNHWSFKKAFYISLPLFTFPLVSVVSREFYMILNQHAVHILSPDLFYVMAVLVACAFCMRNFFRRKPEIRVRRWFNHYIYPVLLVGILFFTQYQPFLVQPLEPFELANPANAVMRLINYHEIPILQALSSHVLSDINLKLIYVLLNGYNGSVDFLLYDFAINALYLVVFYFFLSRILKDSLLVFLLALFIPYISVAVLGSHALALISIFMVYQLFQEYSFRRLFWLVVWSLFLITWKIEVGVSSLIACALLYVLFFLRYSGKKLILDVLKVLRIVLIAGILIAVISVLNGIDIWGNFLQARDYFGANQAHGFAQITSTYDRIFYFHYFIFPAIALFMFFFIVFREGKKLARPDFLITSLLFLLVYYFTQAQRGLVRHSLFEGSDLFFSSFFYLIVSLFIWYLTRKKVYAKYLFVVSFIFMVYDFEISHAGNKSNYEELFTVFSQDNRLPAFNQKVDRVTGRELFAKDNYDDFKTFLDRNFDKNATFIDFSNTPMLYFYTKRRVPSYFNQYMQSTVTEFLQQKNLSYLKKWNVPVVVFSYDQESWWDNTDGVPNTIRYNLIAEYIFRNYTPLTILNHHYIWIRKGIQSKTGDSVRVRDSYVHAFKHFQLKKYPYLLAQTKKIADARIIQSWNADSAIMGIDRGDTYRNYIRVTALNSSGKNAAMTLRYYKNDAELGSFEFSAMPSSKEEKYVIPVSSQYNWVSDTITRVKISAEDGMTIRRIDLLAGK